MLTDSLSSIELLEVGLKMNQLSGLHLALLRPKTWTMIYKIYQIGLVRALLDDSCSHKLKL